MSGFIFNLSKWALALFPPTWPSKIYNMSAKIPPLKRCISGAVQRLAPDHIDIEEGRVIFDKEDPVISGGLSLGKYEPETVALFRSKLREGMTVVDIGANLGYFTVIAARRAGPKGRVISYEPDPHNFALLKSNIEANGFRNVKAIPIALSDERGSRELFFGDNHCTHSFDDKKRGGSYETVETDTLDHSLEALGSPKIDMIKMDIEGAEPIALDGMARTIASNPGLTMIFEFYPNAIKRLGYSPLGFLEKLRGFGFSLSAIDEDSMSLIGVSDLSAFAGSFGEKDLSRNMIAAGQSPSTMPLAREQSYTVPVTAFDVDRNIGSHSAKNL